MVVGEFITIQSAVGKWGTWTDNLICPGIIFSYSNKANVIFNAVYSFSVKQQIEKDCCSTGDCMGIIDMKIYCSRLQILEQNSNDAQELREAQGTWSRKLSCLPGEYIVGIYTVVQPYKPLQDDTALNGARLYCKHV